MIIRMRLLFKTPELLFAPRNPVPLIIVQQHQQRKELRENINSK